METKNKFAHPPYLPEYSYLELANLMDILSILGETCCRHKTPEGVKEDVSRLLRNPSSIRKCDLYLYRPIIEACKRLKIDDKQPSFTVTAQGEK